MCAPCTCLGLSEAKEGVDSGIGVTGFWGPTCGDWELNEGPLQEQVLLNAEQSPKLPSLFFYDKVLQYISDWPGTFYVPQEWLQTHCSPYPAEY